jgi:hypothetical protein
MRMRLCFDAAIYETVAVTPLAPGRVRLDEALRLVPAPVCVGDVLEVAARPDGTHQFVRVAERAPARR